MRKQYFFRESPRGILAWDVDRLVAASAAFVPRRVALSSIRELRQAWSGDGETQTCEELIAHVRLIEAAELAYPIILSADGSVMDGMHRIAKAVLAGHGDIVAVQFDRDPEPDFVGRGPNDLPY
ncbi:MAG: hypothetical protein FJ202_04750 [Gemmatimonadetes bacterium]|nr:hypothetical protein [Gemmatimonadota bacterium]